MPVFAPDGSIKYYDLSHLPGIIDCLGKLLKIAIVFGGDGSAPGAVKYRSLNTRNWKSYEVVATDIKDTLTKLGFRHTVLLRDDSSLLENLIKHDIHLVWLNSGGVQGYNPMSHAPAMLEMMGIPYIGHDPLNVTVLDNKDLFKQQLVALGFPTSPFFTWNKIKDGNNVYWLEKLPSIFGDYRGPFVVKPVSGRASINIHVADTIAEIPRLVDEIYKTTFNHVLIEKYLPGKEYCVAIYGNVKHSANKLTEFDQPFSFSEVERHLEPGEMIFTSMDKKAITKNRVRLLTKAEDREVKEKLGNLARDVYTYFGLTTLIRLDVRANEEGGLNILEVNPKPDLKKPENGVISIVSAGLEEQDMTYQDLIIGILATRLHQLFGVQRSYIQHIIKLVSG